MKVKVEGHTNLVRDMKSGAIISTSTVEYMNYMKAVKLKEEEKSVMTMKKAAMIITNKNTLQKIVNILKQLKEK